MALFDVAKSFAKNAAFYHSSTSDMLKRSPTCNYASAADSKSNNSPINLDLSLFMKSHAISKNKTFLDSADSLRKRILNES